MSALLTTTGEVYERKCKVFEHPIAKGAELVAARVWHQPFDELRLPALTLWRSHEAAGSSIGGCGSEVAPDGDRSRPLLRRQRFDLGPVAASRVEHDPAMAREIDLDPGMCATQLDRLDAGVWIDRTWQEPVGDPGWHAQVAQSRSRTSVA